MALLQAARIVDQIDANTPAAVAGPGLAGDEAWFAFEVDWFEKHVAPPLALRLKARLSAEPLLEALPWRALNDRMIEAALVHSLGGARQRRAPHGTDRGDSARGSAIVEVLRVLGLSPPATMKTLRRRLRARDQVIPSSVWDGSWRNS